MGSVRKLESLTVEQYFGVEAEADVRHEYVDGAIYAMVGATARHNRIALALAGHLNRHLEGSGCQTFISDMKVRAAAAFYYPDVVVTCAPIEPEAVYLTEPKLVIEVLSESTEGRDRLEKWAAYRTLNSLEEYVLVAQDRRAIDVYRRFKDGWKQVGFESEEELELDSVNLRLPMADIYADLP